MTMKVVEWTSDLTYLISSRQQLIGYKMEV